jgi:hypothetical protein
MTVESNKPKQCEKTCENFIVYLKFVMFLGGLPTTLQLKRLVPVMITVNSATKRYKENGKTSVLVYQCSMVELQHSAF